MKTIQPMVKFSHRPQVAALPVRLGQAGLEVMLITSRETGRWLVPKGWPMKGVEDCQAAAIEALEEAGVSGRIARHPLGAYTYQKRMPNGPQACHVMVYRLDVQTELAIWREREQRTRQWFNPAEAACLVCELGLSALIRKLNQRDPSEADLPGQTSASGTLKAG